MSFLLACYCRQCCVGGSSPVCSNGLRTVDQNHDCAYGGDLGTQLCFLVEPCLNCIIYLVLEATIGQTSPGLHHLKHHRVMWNCLVLSAGISMWIAPMKSIVPRTSFTTRIWTLLDVLLLWHTRATWWSSTSRTSW